MRILLINNRQNVVVLQNINADLLAAELIDKKGSMQNVGCHFFNLLAYSRLYNIKEKRKQTTVNNSILSGFSFWDS